MRGSRGAHPACQLENIRPSDAELGHVPGSFGALARSQVVFTVRMHDRSRGCVLGACSPGSGAGLWGEGRGFGLERNQGRGGSRSESGGSREGDSGEDEDTAGRSGYQRCGVRFFILHSSAEVSPP